MKKLFFPTLPHCVFVIVRYAVEQDGASMEFTSQHMCGVTGFPRFVHRFTFHFCREGGKLWPYNTLFHVWNALVKTTSALPFEHTCKLMDVLLCVHALYCREQTIVPMPFHDGNGIKATLVGRYWGVASDGPPIFLRKQTEHPMPRSDDCTYHPEAVHSTHSHLHSAMAMRVNRLFIGRWEWAIGSRFAECNQATVNNTKIEGAKTVCGMMEKILNVNRIGGLWWEECSGRVGAEGTCEGYREGLPVEGVFG